VTLRIRDLYALRSFYRPGEPLTFRAELESSRRQRAASRLNVVRPDGVARVVTGSLDLVSGASQVEFVAEAAGAGRHGYVVELVITDEKGNHSSAFAAADVLRSWKDDPRYGFLSDFSPNDKGIEERVGKTARFHLNCLQFYDWMYRHYRLLPPSEQFKDALGRRLSLKTVRRAIDAAHTHRTAAVAYAAVYAAEPEFYRTHREWGLYRADGSSYMLGDLFHLMDLAPSSPWVRHMLGDFRRTLKAIRFDGFHLDQYGFPRVAYDSDGELRDLGSDFASFVDAASEVTARHDPDGGNIFNAVNAWPVEHVARRKQVATYVEVWPPYVGYADLVAIVRRCHDLAPGKPVILAAYASFLAKKPGQRTGAAGLALLSAVIFSTGAWHLLLGEGEAALTHAYYPKYARLGSLAIRTLRRYYDFAVGYREFLRDPSLREVAATFIDSDEPTFGVSIPYSSSPKPGHIWTGIKTKPGWVVISLVNLLDESDLMWDRAREAPKTRFVKLKLPNETLIKRCLVASPDGDGSLAPVSCAVDPSDGRTVEVALSTWTLVLVETETSRSPAG
jgi:dextranase